MRDHWWYPVFVIVVAWVVGFYADDVFRAIMRVARRQVYKRGFRPQPGTFLHSPSLELTYNYLEAVKNYDHSGAVFQSMTGIINEPGIEIIDNPRPVFLLMGYCPECGIPLEHVLLDQKECPRGCGYLYTRETEQGLDAITFARY